MKVVAILVALLLVIGGLGLFWAERQINPGGHHGPDVAVVIPKGASTSNIAHILSRAGVIHDATLFSLYVRLNGTGILLSRHLPRCPRTPPTSRPFQRWRTGRHWSPTSWSSPKASPSATWPPPWPPCPGSHLSAPEVRRRRHRRHRAQPLRAGRDQQPRRPPVPRHLPGPAGRDRDRHRRSRWSRAFDQRAQAIGLAAAAAKLGETPYALVTVASIVEREAKLPGDRGPGRQRHLQPAEGRACRSAWIRPRPTT